MQSVIGRMKKLIYKPSEKIPMIVEAPQRPIYRVVVVLQRVERGEEKEITKMDSRIVTVKFDYMEANDVFQAIGR